LTNVERNRLFCDFLQIGKTVNLLFGLLTNAIQYVLIDLNISKAKVEINGMRTVP
jgi:hypothetical protein